MLNNFALPVVDLKRLPPLFYLSIGGLLGLLMVTFVLGERAEQKQAELLREYGTAIAQLSAQEVVDATISQDLVSMHAVMQTVVAQPRVVLATVHDLDQKLVVQAGQTNRRVLTQIYSAPIPLHDSIAGHVTLTMDASFPDESAVKWTLTGTGLLLLLMATLALYESRGTAWRWRRQEHSEVVAEDENAGLMDEALVDDLLEEVDHYFHEDDAQALDNLEETRSATDAVSITSPDASDDVTKKVQGGPALLHTDLIMALPNRNRLEQQLNSERYLQMSSQFEKTLDDVLALYGGSRVEVGAETAIYCIRFTSSESLEEAAFRATCSAYLVHNLTQKNKIHFQLIAQVCDPDSDVKLALGEVGVFVQKALAGDFLQARLILQPAGEERLKMEGLKSGFASLLARQQEQLER